MVYKQKTKKYGGYMILFMLGLFVGFIIGFCTCALWAGRSNKEDADFSHEKVINLVVEKEKKIIDTLYNRGQ